METNENNKSNTVVAKMVKAISEIGAFTADKTNTSQNYEYISADLVLERGGQALAKQGLILIPSILDSKTEQVEYTAGSNSKKRIDAKVIFQMTLTDGESMFTESWVGCGSDFSAPDKALYKAITSGHKYFLMKILQISIGNSDSEHE